jgi:hypothetical protein
MGIFKTTLIFFVLQLFLKSTTAGEPDIACVADGLAGDAGSAFLGVVNSFSSFDPTPLSGFGLGLLDTAIGIWGGPADCYDELVKKLEEHFVTKEEFTKFKSRLDTITAEMKMDEIKKAKERMADHKHWIKDPHRIRDYVNEFKDYLYRVSRNVEQLFQHIVDFHHPIEKMTNLILGSAYVKDLTRMSTSFAYSAYMCHYQGNCRVSDIETYAETLKTVSDRIRASGKSFWKVERSLFDARMKPSSIEWNGWTRGFQLPVDCRTCLTTRSGSTMCGGLKYRVVAPRGARCYYKDNLYAHSGTVDIKKERNWDTLDHHKEWKCWCRQDCQRKGPGWADGEQVCDQEGSGYPRRKMAKHLAQKQRKKLVDLFNENFNDYSDKLICPECTRCKYANWGIVKMASCTLRNKVDKNLCHQKSSDYLLPRWQMSIHCRWPNGYIEPWLTSKDPFTRRQLLTEEDEQEFCKNLNSETVGKFVKEHGVENLPECYPVPQIAKEFVEESQRAHNITEVHDIHAIPMRNQTREFSQRIRYKL